MRKYMVTFMLRIDAGLSPAERIQDVVRNLEDQFNKTREFVDESIDLCGLEEITKCE